MFSKCDVCGDNLVKLIACSREQGDPSNIAPTFYQWITTNGHVDKVAMNEHTFEDATKMIQETVEDFKVHTFTKRAQSLSFSQDKSILSTEPRKCVIQLDFAENYSCNVQDEIQAHHFKGGQQISILTVCAWWRERHLAAAGVSDSLEHSKFSNLCHFH
jgi:hypothetical protein